VVNNFYTRSAARYIAEQREKKEAEERRKRQRKCPHCGSTSFHNTYHVDFWISECNNQECWFQYRLSCYEAEKLKLVMTG